jgi:Lipid A 3-O-deacylase (PagL)
MTWRGAVVIALLAMIALSPYGVFGYDSNETFRKGAFVLSAEGGGGHQHDLEGHPDETGLTFLNGGVRLSFLPFGPTFRGPAYGALEIGLEPFAQGYIDPVRAYFAGLAAVGRYHFLSLSRFVPYVEVAGAAGGTTLRVREIDSTFTFLIFGGVGASYFLTDHTALYAGYRLQHVSNGNTSLPNRGFESHTGVAGVSIYFP